MARKGIDYVMYFYIFIGIVLVLNFLVALYLNYGCRFQKTITVSKIISSYRSGKSGLNLFSDSKGNVYVVKNSILQLFFKAPELYSQLEEGKTYQIKGYGIRFEYLGWYPHVTEAIEVSRS